MKKGIHPENYRFVVFKDMSCNHSFLTKSTAPSKETVLWEDGNEYPLIKLEISDQSHPFYTGKMKLVDTAGRVDKFRKKYENHIKNTATPTETPIKEVSSTKASKPVEKAEEDSPAVEAKEETQAEEAPATEAKEETHMEEAPAAETKEETQEEETPVVEAKEETQVEEPPAAEAKEETQVEEPPTEESKEETPMAKTEDLIDDAAGEESTEEQAPGAEENTDEEAGENSEKE